jgi:hypothetical protein
MAIHLTNTEADKMCMFSKSRGHYVHGEVCLDMFQARIMSDWNEDGLVYEYKLLPLSDIIVSDSCSPVSKKDFQLGKVMFMVQVLGNVPFQIKKVVISSCSDKEFWYYDEKYNKIVSRHFGDTGVGRKHLIKIFLTAQAAKRYCAKMNKIYSS